MKSKNQIIGKSGNSRRGSALLVVLGMLAFMLFSGLAFSVYMRQSRLPTSFLRRTVATRELVKAALAEAIEEIDTAIGNDVHPGVRGDRSYTMASSVAQYDKPVGYIDNIWSHRVFGGWCKGNLDSEVAKKRSLTLSAAANEQKGDKTPYYSSPSDTVPTLTLEGLAYLPPNLINEVRYYSQRTPTAKWHSFWFDSGRYAYTAIDVSDYFDIHRVYANKPRSSGHRVSLAHLFETGADHSGAPDASNVRAWDTFMEEYRPYDDEGQDTGKMPLVSLADFMVAMGDGKAGFKSPFRNFLSGNLLYESDNPDDDKVEKYRNMTFVTDGWLPKSVDKNGTARFSLDDPKYQPFKYSSLKKSACAFPNLDDMADTGSLPYSPADAKEWLLGDKGGLRLNVPNMVALWDYLDEDMIPASLCVPTVERTPMICGIQPDVQGNVDVKVLKTTPAADQLDTTVSVGGEDWDFYTREVEYTVDFSAMQAAIANVMVLMTYPFNDRGITAPDAEWDVDGRLSFFLSTGGTFPMRFDESNFTAAPKKTDFDRTELTDNSLISYHLDASSGKIYPENFSDRNDLGMACVRAMLKPSASVSAPTPLKVRYRWRRDRYEDPNNPGTPLPKANGGVPVVRQAHPDLTTTRAGDTTATITQDGSLFSLASNGKRANNGGDWSTISGNLVAMNATPLKLNFATWIRLMDKSKNAVDFVPACQIDDVNMNDADYSKCSRECGGGGYYPMMRVEAADTAGTQLELSLAKMESGSLGIVTFPNVKWIISDPRYNYAPENWVQTVNGGVLQEADWKNDADIQKMITDRDGDAYMATSDAGYLQSVYELAFLPRVAEGFTETLKGNAFPANLSTTFDGQFAPTHARAKDAGFMWKTYNPMGRYRNDEFDDLEDVFETNGMAVDPYSDTTAVLLAAFANTPYDWRVAATSDYARTHFSIPEDAATFNKNYAWNDYPQSKKNRICWDCLEAIAEEFKAKVRKAGNWEDAFADLAWSKESNKILDFEETDFDEDADSPMYGVDKKFLYGFWHDSFAARQQLFLVFVRAEPMMMGGGVSGQVPPQLGARAVALVWRDPTKTQPRSTGESGSSGGSSTTLANPHRTRILFYHQFD